MEYIQETTFFPKLQKSEEILEIRKKLKFSFLEFRIILPNRSNRSNRKKSLNRLDRFIGQRINKEMGYPFRSTVFVPMEF